MTPEQFIAKWRGLELTERAASQTHFNDLCRMLGVPAPYDDGTDSATYCFEKGGIKTTGGTGWADVWKSGCFAREYKGKFRNLDSAFAQLQQYALALENPPLLAEWAMAKAEIDDILARLFALNQERAQKEKGQKERDG